MVEPSFSATKETFLLERRVRTHPRTETVSSEGDIVRILLIDRLIELPQLRLNHGMPARAGAPIILQQPVSVNTR
jgi:hypothetical protein